MSEECHENPHTTTTTCIYTIAAEVEAVTVTFMSRAEGVPGKSCPPEGLEKINDAQGVEWNGAQRSGT